MGLMLTEQQGQLLRVLSLAAPAAIILFALNRTGSARAPVLIPPPSGKEPAFLVFNKDEIFTNLLHTEGHFKKLSSGKPDTEGYMNCAVKHMADAEGHAEEAIGHSLVVNGSEMSGRFAKLHDDMLTFRHELMTGKVTPTIGIERTRQLRHDFESFNPEYDISKCTACSVEPIK